MREYQNRISDEEGELVKLYFRMDSVQDTYSRKIYAILELLGDIGGLHEFLFLLGWFLVNFITSRQFVSSILKKVYYTRTHPQAPPGSNQAHRQRTQKIKEANFRDKINKQPNID